MQSKYLTNVPLPSKSKGITSFIHTEWEVKPGFSSGEPDPEVGLRRETGRFVSWRQRGGRIKRSLVSRDTFLRLQLCPSYLLCLLGTLKSLLTSVLGTAEKTGYQVHSAGLRPQTHETSQRHKLLPAQNYQVQVVYLRREDCFVLSQSDSVCPQPRLFHWLRSTMTHLPGGD